MSATDIRMAAGLVLVTAVAVLVLIYVGPPPVLMDRSVAPPYPSNTTT